MKKISAILALIILVASLAGCGTTTAVKEEKVKLSDELAAVEKVLKDEGYIPKDAVKTGMTPVSPEGTKKEYGGYLEIGAVEGVRYTFKYNESDVNLELYRYDTDKIEDKGKEVIASVKDKGSFFLADGDEEITAYLSADEKYLMIYQDSSQEKKNQTRTADVIKLFEGYSQKTEKEETSKSEDKTDSAEKTDTSSSEDISATTATSTTSEATETTEAQSAKTYYN